MDGFAFDVLEASHTIKLAVIGVPDVTPEHAHITVSFRPNELEIVYTREGRGPWALARVDVTGMRVLKSGVVSSTQELSVKFWRQIPGRKFSLGPEWGARVPVWVRVLADRYPTPETLTAHSTDVIGEGS